MPAAVAHAHATVDLASVAHNTTVFTRHTGADVLAVVKADGFGHGATHVARTVLAAGAAWLGVATCSEARQLRADGITAPILSWLHGPGENFAAVVGAGIELAASSGAQLAGIAAGATACGETANVHLKVDTGLHRSGALSDDWPELVRRAREAERIGNVRVRGVWSHLISGEHPAAGPSRDQVARFDEAVEQAREAGLRPEIRHLANSAAALVAPETHYELVRPGIGLYGVEPIPERSFGLRQAMTLRAPLVLVKRVPAGSGVSYEHDYVTTSESTLGLVPLGYADGVPWSAARNAQVWIGGRRYPVAGRVAMDQFVVDLGDADAEPGQEVVVFGPGDAGEPTAAEWAEWAGTVPHEILAGVGPRVPRRYTPAPDERSTHDAATDAPATDHRETAHA